MRDSLILRVTCARARSHSARILLGVALCAAWPGAVGRAQPQGVEAGTAAPPGPDAELKVHAAPGPLAPGAVVEDWPSFLGQRRDSTSRETHLDLAFGVEGPRLLWERERGSGYASPAIAGDQLVFTHRVGDTVFVDCLEATSGKRRWRYEYPTTYAGRYIENAGPRSTPTIAGGRVFVHGVDGELFALELDTGALVWRRNTHTDFGVGDNFFGVVSTPLVLDGELIQNIGAPGGPSVAGFDLGTGKLVWGVGEEWGPSCASPVAAEVHGEPKLFVLAGGQSRPPTGGLLGIDLATKAIEFRYGFRSRTYESVNAATPVVAGDRVYLTASYGVGSAALALDAEGGFEQLWKNRRIELQFSTQVVLDGVLYGVDGVSGRVGALLGIEPDTGEELWRETLEFESTFVDAGEEKTLTSSVGEGSLLAAEGKLLVLGDTGQLVVLVPGETGADVLAHTTLFHAAETWTPLVISHGLLYVCQNERARFGASPPRLLCYDLRAGGVEPSSD